jgi:tRNA-2-methylthio-N6-dimethylallyladenosine synthase
MNQLDSELVAGKLIMRGFEQVQSESEADIILLNTCSVRDMAERKVMGKLGLLGKVKRQRPGLVLGVLGCMAQSKKETLFKKLPVVDLVCGTQSIDLLPSMLEDVIRTRQKRIEVSEEETHPTGSAQAARSNIFKTFVSVMRGCDNYCSYCIVPYVRGRETSRPSKDIIDEVKILAEKGYLEITFLGQNVNSYGRGLDENVDFADLLEKLNDIDGIRRIRFVTSHPKDISEKLVKAVGRLEKVCHSLHFPLQSGSDPVLKQMNRGYTSAQYLEKVQMLRETVPDIALSSDIIVGFPGETEEDFRDTFKMMEKIEYDSAFVFKYSLRKGTKAASLVDSVPFDVKKERNKILLELQQDISARNNARLIGARFDVLVEGPSKTDKTRLMGRTTHNRIAVFESAENLEGKIVPVQVDDTTSLTLFCHRI